MTSQKGFTIVELLVYIAMSSIVVVVAATAWYNSATFSLVSQKSLDLSGRANLTLKTIARDLERMGLSAGQSGATVNITDLVYMDEDVDDRSSFEFWDNSNKDSLIFRTARFNNTQSIIGYEEVTYKIENNQLLRVSAPYGLVDDAGDITTTIMEENVETFNIELGVYGRKTLTGDSVLKEHILDSTSTSNNIGSFASAAYLASIGDFDAEPGIFITPTMDDRVIAFQWMEGGNAFEFEPVPGETYTLSFNTSFNDDFISSYNAARDSIVIRLKHASDTSSLLVGTEPYRIYPSSNAAIVPRRYDFNTSHTGKIIIQIITSLSRVGGSPTIGFNGFQISQHSLASSNYLSQLTGSIDEQIKTKMATKSLKITLGLMDKVNQDTIRWESERKIDISNNGVMP
jgi:type II secretory pathway component PulJ